MIILPLPNDVVVTKDGASLIVVGYTNYKTKGPAIYCRPVDSDSTTPLIAIYFFDIEKINDVRVEFSSSSKVFTAYGRVKRRIHLPQVHDFISVFNKESDEKNDFNDSVRVKVVGHKLHSKKFGVSKGLLLEDEDKNVYRLDEVLDLHRDSGTSMPFDRKKFLQIYREYSGHRA